MGGPRPDLSDAAVWGVLRAVRGLQTETVMLDPAHSRIGAWYTAMRAEMEKRGGSALVHRVGEAPLGSMGGTQSPLQ